MFAEWYSFGQPGASSQLCCGRQRASAGSPSLNGATSSAGAGLKIVDRQGHRAGSVVDVVLCPLDFLAVAFPDGRSRLAGVAVSCSTSSTVGAVRILGLEFAVEAAGTSPRSTSRADLPPSRAGVEPEVWAGRSSGLLDAGDFAELADRRARGRGLRTVVGGDENRCASGSVMMPGGGEAGGLIPTAAGAKTCPRRGGP